ncbi:putative endo-beta-1,4-glucanase D [Geopyxis carbonaria]|nr:putative endo-beta-1,4-glucanase D [Geopyxis carbonaria]
MVSFTTLLPVLAAMIGAANAHTRVYSLWVNDVDQGDGRDTYIRSPPSNSPVKDVSSSDIICNVNNVAVAKNVDVAAGDKVTFEWYHDTRADDIIASSHKGPITVYIADAATEGKGDVWTKLAEDGLTDGTWAVDTLIANGGKHSLTLPAALAAGDYLLRAEIIALHESDTDYTVNSARGAQFYPSCSQITVSGSGTATPPGTFGFVGGYSPEDPGILFNLYGGETTYAIPGPAVWDGTSSGSGSAATTKAAATSAAASTKAATSAAATTKAATTAAATSAAATSAAATSAAVAPADTTKAATTAAAVTTKATVSKPAAIVTTKAVTTAPVATSVAPTTLVTKTRAATTAAASAPAASAPATGGAKTSAQINACLDAVNACISKAQSRTGGSVSFSTCEAQRAACY